MIVDGRETSPVEALKASWNALKTDLLNTVLLVFVLGLAAAAGFLGCGVGLLFTYPLLPLGYALLYRDFFGIDAAAPVEIGFSGPQNPWVARPAESAYPAIPPPPQTPSEN